MHGFLEPRRVGQWNGTHRPTRRSQRELGLSVARPDRRWNSRPSGLWAESPDDGHGAGCDEDGDAVGPAAVRQQNRAVGVFGAHPAVLTRFNPATWDPKVATAKHKRSAAQTRRALAAGEVAVRAAIADHHDPAAWSGLVTWLQSALGATVVVYGGGGGHPRPASAVAAVASALALKKAPCFLTSDMSAPRPRPRGGGGARPRPDQPDEGAAGGDRNVGVGQPRDVSGPLRLPRRLRAGGARPAAQRGGAAEGG